MCARIVKKWQIMNALQTTLNDINPVRLNNKIIIRNTDRHIDLCLKWFQMNKITLINLSIILRKATRERLNYFLNLLLFITFCDILKPSSSDKIRHILFRRKLKAQKSSIIRFKRYQLFFLWKTKNRRGNLIVEIRLVHLNNQKTFYETHLHSSFLVFINHLK